MSETTRRAALLEHTQNLYQQIQDNSINHLELVTQAVKFSTYLVRQDLGSGQEFYESGQYTVTNAVLGDLQAVFIGNGLALGRGIGPFWIGNTVGINEGRRGASGFNENFVDNTDQVQHAIGGIIGSFQYSSIFEWLVQIREESAADENINVRTFNLGNQLDDSNIDDLARALEQSLSLDIDTNLSDFRFSAQDNQEFNTIFQSLNGSCFLAGTLVSIPAGVTKPIEAVQVGDWVQSYDKLGDLVARRVTQTFQKQVDHVLDFFGLMVTPGHVTLCGDGKYAARHVPIIDILRSDGAVVRQDGSLVRAATNEPVGSTADAFVHCAFARNAEELRSGITHDGRMRVGTRLMKRDGTSVSVLECIEADGMTFDPATGLVCRDGETPQPLQFFGALPKPEDHVLARSKLTLNDIYAAGEWDDMQPLSPAPSAIPAGKLQ